MKNSKFLVLFLPLLLAGCNNFELYPEGKFNSPVFDENYYLNFNGLDSLDLPEAACSFTKTNVYSFANKMSALNENYKKGVLSKLYDGRTACEGLYERARVQIDKSGFGTKIPETITSISSFSFAACGRTSLKSTTLTGDQRLLGFDINLSLFTTSHVYKIELTDLALPVDAGGSTKLYTLTFDAPIEQFVGYSISYDCLDSNLPTNFSTDKDNKEKDHLALMLYEVFFPY